MTSYIVKPNYNGTDKKTFTDPVEAVAYYQKYVESVSGKMIGTLEDKMEEMVWIEKLQIIENNAWQGPRSLLQWLQWENREDYTWL